ncbi:hypothetical protein BPNPMPFG_000297 [Mesorhizobium sp. AR07]|uniref:hypothetical protein n=1 Tax=Mesorhizobium sp. AR07 TaxID=2865838 RepID=UPI00215FE420|nr:hypothetical protein [Mesorhizobium sp. AR07]UVK44832.1 hypothetical protein BPNPMPFG_000297 [Mesorhizobium sp. AR07]
MTPTKDVGSLDQFQLVLYASKGAEPPLNGTDITVLLELVDRFKKKDGVTFPSSAGHLARETGRPVRSVQESLRRLQDMHLARIVEQGTGTRGNTYNFNFDWVREVAAEIKSEIESRAVARKKRKKKNPASDADNRVGSNETLPTRKSAPLRDIVTRKFAHLTGVPTRESAPQTYGVPTGTYVGGADAPPFGYATSGIAPLKKDGKPDFTVYPDVERWVMITSVEEESLDDVEDGNSKVLTVFYVTDCGIQSYIFLTTESDDDREQADGQEVLASVCAAVGLDQIEDAKELVGRRAKLVLHYHNGSFVSCVPRHTNDDFQQAA